MEQINNVIIRAVLTGSIEKKPLRNIQVERYDADIRDKTEHFEPYGYTSAPAPSVAANVGTALDSVTGDDVASTMSYDELISVRDEILEAIDDEMLRVYDDDVYTALQDARTNVWECVTERANDNARIVTITQNEVTPAIVLAYDYYGDANRDSEIIGRNGISNPNFLPASELKLLSR